jgi:hypothetical protein
MGTLSYVEFVLFPEAMFTTFVGVADRLLEAIQPAGGAAVSEPQQQVGADLLILCAVAGLQQAFMHATEWRLQRAAEGDARQHEHFRRWSVGSCRAAACCSCNVPAELCVCRLGCLVHNRQLLENVLHLSSGS